MDKEELEKEITGILYNHTDIPAYVIVEADYEVVVKDIVKLFSMHFVIKAEGDSVCDEPMFQCDRCGYFSLESNTECEYCSQTDL